MIIRRLKLNNNLIKRVISQMNMSIFTQSFDLVTGHAVWEEKSTDYDYHQEVARSAFADMLHDNERNQKYYIALEKAIEKLHRKGLKANVLDIGTGTGLLSMMAAKCGADTIVACEAFRPMAECAEKIIKDNGFESQIKLIKKKSIELVVGSKGDMEQRANILVTEVFDTELIGEGALSTFQHAHDKLLENDCIVIPSRGIVWVQVVESLTVRKWNKIIPIKDPKTDQILLNPPDAINSCPGSLAVHDVQLSQLDYQSFKILIPPQAVFKFDWSKPESIIFNEIKTIDCSAIASGDAHAVFMWWELLMDDDDEIILSCAPSWEHPETKSSVNSELSMADRADKIPWRDHWMQAIYYLPIELSVSVDENLTITGCHDEFSFWFNLQKSSAVCKINNPVSPLCDCTLHLAYSRTRIAQLNDPERNNKYISVFKKYITPDTECLCISDGCLIALLTVILNAKKLTVFEPNTLSRKIIHNFIKFNELTDKVQVIDSIDEFKWTQKSHRLVIGDPYYVNSIFPWDNYRFWYLLSTYTPEVPSVPAAACIRGIVVEFKDLHKIRAPVGTCEGFNLKHFDRLVLTSSEISDRPVEVHPLWEYPCRALSAPFDIALYKFDSDFFVNSEVTYSGQTPIQENGRCNGIALWVDWYLDLETVVSTGPTDKIELGKRISWNMYNRQGVSLLREFKNVTKNSMLTWSFRYRGKNNDYFDFNYHLKEC